MAAGMEQMDTGCLRLQSEPKALYIREAEIREAAGEHGVMNIRFIPAKVPEEPDILRGQGSMVRLTTADGETVFCGKCENLHLSCENQYAEMELTARTLSVLKDQGQKTASYQGTDKMLSEVFAAGIGEDALFQLDKDEKVPEMLLQDRETDWEFGRRLAYRKKRLLFVNSKASGCQIHAGAVPFAKKEAGKVLVRRVRRDVDRVRGIQGNTVPGTSVFEHEETILVVCDLTIGAGYSVCFDGRDMIVVKSHITCEQGLLQNEITLVNKEGLLPSAGQTMEAARQTGILRGKVLAVDGTNVQVDFGTPGDQPRWIPYANTVSNYFYCMPDTGDMVEVYYEMDAGERVVCLGSRHAGDNPDFGRYQDKMLTAQNRMVKFGEKALHLIGNRSEFDGKGGEQAKIILNSEQGVEVQSTKDIQLKTEGGNITFQSAPRSYAGTDGVRMASAAMHQVGNVMHMAMAGIGPVFNMAGYVDPGFWTKLRKEVADHAPQSGGDGKVNLMGMKKVILQTGSSSAAFVKGKIHIKADIFQQLGINRSRLKAQPFSRPGSGQSCNGADFTGRHLRGRFILFSGIQPDLVDFFRPFLLFPQLSAGGKGRPHRTGEHIPGFQAASCDFHVGKTVSLSVPRDFKDPRAEPLRINCLRREARKSFKQLFHPGEFQGGTKKAGKDFSFPDKFLYGTVANPVRRQKFV